MYLKIIAKNPFYLTYSRLSLKVFLTLLHSERPKLCTVLTFLSAVGLKWVSREAAGPFLFCLSSQS